MKRILLPVDFSEIAANTLKYAQKLARDKGWQLSLLYCFPEEEYSRKYDFPNKDYGEGIKGMLRKFYQENSSDPVGETRFFAIMGSVVENVIRLSGDFQLILLSSKSYSAAINRWIGTRSTAIASLAACPVIMVPASAEYKPWENIWHVKRKETETAILEPWIKRLSIDPAIIQTKSMQQSSFTSLIWKSMVAYIKKPEESLRKVIIEASPSEEIHLILLVSHQKNTFRHFVQDEAVQILFEFGIPVMIVQGSV